MNEVIDLKVLQDYRIWLRFKDGEEKVINFRPFIGKGFTAELLDKEKFKNAFIEPGGGIDWENGYDFCPNFLKELAAEKDGGVSIRISGPNNTKKSKRSWKLKAGKK